MKKIIALFLTAALLFGLTACKEPDLVFAAGAKGSMCLEYSQALANAIEDATDITIDIQKTKGALSNMQIVDLETEKFGITQLDLLNHSWNETGVFRTEGGMDSLRAIGAVYTEALQLITSDPTIQGVEDLKGKRVSLGLTGSGSYFVATEILEDAGFKEKDLEMEEFSIEETFNAFKKGKLDAAFIFSALPTSAIADSMKKQDLSLVPIEEKYLDLLQRSCEDLTDYTIPAETYAGQKEPVQTLATKAVLFCGADCTEAEIHTVTSVLFESTDLIDHPLAEPLTLEFATDGIDLPFHKGAATYYAEQGLDVYRK